MILVKLGWTYSGTESQYSDFDEIIHSYYKQEDKSDLYPSLIELFKIYEEHKIKTEGMTHVYDFMLSQIEQKLVVHDSVGLNAALGDFLYTDCFSPKDEIQKCILSVLANEDILFVVSARKWIDSMTLELDVTICHLDVNLNLIDDNLKL